MNQLFAADALLPTGWARNVLIEWDGAGRIAQVTPAPQPCGRAYCRRPGDPRHAQPAFRTPSSAPLRG